MGYPHYSSECYEYWPTVTLCGSMRFRNEMLVAAQHLSMGGQIVLMPFVVVASEEQTSDDKIMLDLLHKKKIDMSKKIVVVSDESGYYGDSTKDEIRYAQLQGKQVSFVKVSKVLVWVGN